MAVFSGNWKDAEGVDFEEHAYERQSAGAKLAQARSFARIRRLRNCPNLGKHMTAVANFWKNYTSALQKERWSDIYGAKQLNRYGESHLAGKGFAAFSTWAYTFLVNYCGTPDWYWGNAGWHVLWWTIDYVHFSDSSIGITVQLTQPVLPDRRDYIAFFMIDPRRIGSPSQRRFTRLIHALPLQTQGESRFTFETFLPWEVTEGEEVSVLYRYPSFTWETDYSLKTDVAA